MTICKPASSVATSYQTGDQQIVSATTKSQYYNNRDLNEFDVLVEGDPNPNPLEVPVEPGPDPEGGEEGTQLEKKTKQM